MWGRVQCKIGKQRLAKTVLTRSAGSFSGPGADFWPHWISKGVPKSTIFDKTKKEKEKKEVQEAVLKQHDLFIDLSFKSVRYIKPSESENPSKWGDCWSKLHFAHITSYVKISFDLGSNLASQSFIIASKTHKKMISPSKLVSGPIFVYCL